MSASVGAVRCVANFENPLHYLAYRRQWVQLAPLDLVQQAPELRIVGDRLLEVCLRPPGCDREHLARQVLPPSLLEPAVGLEMRTVLLGLRPQLRHVLAASGVGEHDGRPPGSVSVEDRKSTRLNSSHVKISYAVFCLKK